MEMGQISRTQSYTSTDHPTAKMENGSIMSFPPFPPQNESVRALQAEQRVPQVDQYPDGGPKAWLAVAGATACLFVSFGWVNAIGIFQEYYQSNQLLDYTSSEIAWIPSLQGMSQPDRTIHTWLSSSF